MVTFACDRCGHKVTLTLDASRGLDAVVAHLRLHGATDTPTPSVRGPGSMEAVQL